MSNLGVFLAGAALSAFLSIVPADFVTQFGTLGRIAVALCCVVVSGLLYILYTSYFTTSLPISTTDHTTFDTEQPALPSDIKAAPIDANESNKPAEPDAPPRSPPPNPQDDDSSIQRPARIISATRTHHRRESSGEFLSTADIVLRLEHPEGLPCDDANRQSVLDELQEELLEVLSVPASSVSNFDVRSPSPQFSLVAFRLSCRDTFRTLGDCISLLKETIGDDTQFTNQNLLFHKRVFSWNEVDSYRHFHRSSSRLSRQVSQSESADEKSDEFFRQSETPDECEERIATIGGTILNEGSYRDLIIVISECGSTECLGQYIFSCVKQNRPVFVSLQNTDCKLSHMDDEKDEESGGRGKWTISFQDTIMYQNESNAFVPPASQDGWEITTFGEPPLPKLTAFYPSATLHQRLLHESCKLIDVINVNTYAFDLSSLVSYENRLGVQLRSSIFQHRQVFVVVNVDEGSPCHQFRISPGSMISSISHPQLSRVYPDESFADGGLEDLYKELRTLLITCDDEEGERDDGMAFEHPQNSDENFHLHPFPYHVYDEPRVLDTDDEEWELQITFECIETGNLYPCIIIGHQHNEMFVRGGSGTYSVSARDEHDAFVFTHDESCRFSIARAHINDASNTAFWHLRDNNTKENLYSVRGGWHEKYPPCGGWQSVKKRKANETIQDRKSDLEIEMCFVALDLQKPNISFDTTSMSITCTIQNAQKATSLDSFPHLTGWFEASCELIPWSLISPKEEIREMNGKEKGDEMDGSSGVERQEDVGIKRFGPSEKFEFRNLEPSRRYKVGVRICNDIVVSEWTYLTIKTNSTDEEELEQSSDEQGLEQILPFFIKSSHGKRKEHGKKVVFEF